MSGVERRLRPLHQDKRSRVTAQAHYELARELREAEQRFDRMLSRARLTLKRTLDELEHGKEVEDGND